MFDKTKKKVNQLAKKVEQKKKISEQSESMKKWSAKYLEAKRNTETEDLNRLYAMFLGSKAVSKNINDQSSTTSKLANNVRAAGYEMIESQVNTLIPEATVRSKLPGYDWLASAVQDKINSDIEESTINKIHDENERLTPIFGYSLVLLCWNPDIKRHLYSGEKEPIKINPKQIVGQRKIFDIQKMDYWFLETPTTKKTIKERYGVDVDSENESEPSLTSVNDSTVKSSGNTDSSELVTEVKCFYRDDEGDVGLFVFVNNTELGDYPKYYLPRVAVCECGKDNPQGTRECLKCSSKKLKDRVDEYETTTENMELTPISYKDTKKTVQVEMVLDESGNQTEKKKIVEEEYDKIIERKITAGTRIKRFKPTNYPIAVRINTPHEYKLGGQSDIAVIYDQLTSLQKVISKIEEKIIKSGAIIAVEEDSTFAITDEVYQIIKMSNKEAIMLKVENLQADIQQDILYAREQYDILKSTLGITDSYQGKADTTAQSGKAKQVQIQQSAGRLGSKIFNKFDFYTQLFRLMFEFDLCFTDEIRPFVRKDAEGKDDWDNFNKYEFLMQDSADEWYYNTDFIIAAESNDGVPNDKMFLIGETKEQFQMGALDIKQFWEQLHGLNYPGASKVLDQIRDRTEETDKVQLLLEQLKELDPQRLADFINATPEVQQQYLDQVMQ